MRVKDFNGDTDDADDGELSMAMAVDAAHGVIRIMFGKPIGWLALPPLEARGFAAMLIAKADEMDGRRS